MFIFNAFFKTYKYISFRKDYFLQKFFTILLYFENLHISKSIVKARKKSSPEESGKVTPEKERKTIHENLELTWALLLSGS